ncbi:hypothetical protein EB796_015543 [Bugula neritina]|uniref:Uncharacterized protein n=1 Tax=Bugula neritina TaxID=10212 RepID=A0A7J7JKQ3_BUGNE|nr:hypothetical protein EB796_015543 [Bugula neritina]
MTPSSEVNLEAMATVLTNREYRLIASDSSEESDSDEEFLSPGTPVVSQINVSYPPADGTPSRAASTLDSISQTLYDNPVAVAAAGALTGIIIGVVLLLKYKKL